ncbi:MAG TPA: DinB family protein [Bacteroidota bacterium]
MKTASVFMMLLLGISFSAGDMPTKGTRADILFWIEDAEKKLVGLAEAMPQEKYSWRPLEGVRSVSEVYMHVVTANFGIPGMIGIDPPMKLDRDMAVKITDKAEVVSMLKKSFAHLKDVIGKITDEDLDKATKMFGQESTYRNVLLLLTTHAHEHLGQSIAYARSNGVTPPWSVGQ